MKLQLRGAASFKNPKNILYVDLGTDQTQHLVVFGGDLNLHYLADGGQ